MSCTIPCAQRCTLLQSCFSSSHFLLPPVLHPGLQLPDLSRRYSTLNCLCRVFETLKSDSQILPRVSLWEVVYCFKTCLNINTLSSDMTRLSLTQTGDKAIGERVNAAQRELSKARQSLFWSGSGFYFTNLCTASSHKNVSNALSRIACGSTSWHNKTQERPERTYRLLHLTIASYWYTSNNPNLLIPYEQYYIQTLYREGKLIPEQTPGETNPLFQTAINPQPPHTTWTEQLCTSLQNEQPPKTSCNKSSNIQRTEVCTTSNSHNKVH